jgi:hypothetical protein
MSSPSQPVNPPITEIKSVTYTSFTVDLFSMVFNSSATFMVKLYDSNNILLDIRRLTMDGSDYEIWQGDDDYVYFWVNKTLHEENTSA